MTRAFAERSGKISPPERYSSDPIWTRGGRRSALRFRPAERTRSTPANDCQGACLSRVGAMTRLPLSPAAAGLLRALLARAGVSRNRILLIELQSVDWQSLTLAGERHRIQLRIAPPDSAAIADRLTIGLEDAEFAIAGQIVADIALVGAPQLEDDGSTTVKIE